MGTSGVSWICSAVAPWCLALGLVISITAEAGQDVPVGASVLVSSGHGPAMPDDLVPQTRSSLSAMIRGRSSNGIAYFGLASLGGQIQPVPDEPAVQEVTPRIDFKRHVRQTPGSAMTMALPDVDRAKKGDPLISLRPAFDTRLQHDQGFQRLRLDGLAFGLDDAAVTSAFTPTEGDVPGPEAVAVFEPWPEGESPTTGATRADVSPKTKGSARSGTSAPLVRDGASPAVARAVALGSSTPVALDSTPFEVAAYVTPAKPTENATPIQRVSRPDFAALLDPARLAREKRCLAEAIYFEARSESEAGQAAVAQVVLNRVNSGLYPPSVCGVVYQNRQHYNACQFSFACEGKSLKITEPDPWAVAVRIADAVTSGQTYSVGVGAATHYHANYVRPRWAKRLKKMDVIGHHVFYKLRPGQT